MRKLTYEEIFSKRPSIDELNSQGRFPIYGVAENIRSLYNVGSIFRTSDAVKLNKLYLTGYTGCPPRREIEKTALGSTESVPWQNFKNTDQAIHELKQNNVQLIALEHTSKSVAYNSIKYEFPVCVLVGNEVDGLSSKTIKQIDSSIEIPMFGLKQSLNVAVAFGIVTYHILNYYLDTRVK